MMYVDVTDVVSAEIRSDDPAVAFDDDISQIEDRIGDRRERGNDRFLDGKVDGHVQAPRRLRCRRK